MATKAKLRRQRKKAPVKGVLMAKAPPARRNNTGEGSYAGTLTDPAVRNQVDNIKRKALSTAEDAQKFLREVGLVGPSGALKKRFGGS